MVKLRVVCLFALALCALHATAHSNLLATVPATDAEEEVVLVKVGDVLCLDGTVEPAKKWAKSKKAPKGVVFFVDSTGQHGWALALRDNGNLTWGTTVDIAAIPNLNANEALADFNGKQNTQAILAAEGDFPAVAVLETAQGWYLPSAGQLRKLTDNLSRVDRTLDRLISNGVQATKFAKGAYWSSSETTDARAWYVVHTGALSNFFGTGYEKHRQYYVRGVIDF